MADSDSPLWDRYHRLLQAYISHGDEHELREVVALSQERGLTLETTSGRVAASVRTVLNAYASIGAQSMVVDVDRRRASHEELWNAHAAPGGKAQGDCLVTLRTPEVGGDTVVIEIRGRRPEEDLPVVRLDYVSPHAEASPSSVAPLSQAIEPRQLYEVLTRLLTTAPDDRRESSATSS
jgi:hypothetical protein